jgi:hypothetical protein
MSLDFFPEGLTQHNDVAVREAFPESSLFSHVPDFHPIEEVKPPRVPQLAPAERRLAAKVDRARKDPLEAFRTHYPKSLAFEYEFQTRKAPFNVVAIYHDDRFTYIKAAPQEVPALYELKDGKASLVNYSYDAGLYTVQKVLDAGWLAIGKARMNFTRDGAK